MAQEIDFSALREAFSDQEKAAFLQFLKQQEKAEKEWEKELSHLPESNIPEENQKKFIKEMAHNAAYFSCFSSPESLSEEEKKQYENSAKLLANENFSFSPELAFLSMRLSERKSLTPILVDQVERRQRGINQNPTFFVKLAGNLALQNTLGSLEVLKNAERCGLQRYALSTSSPKISISKSFVLPPSSHLPNIPMRTASSGNSTKDDFKRQLADTRTPEAMNQYFQQMGMDLAKRQKTQEESTITQNIAKKTGGRKIPFGKIAVASALSTTATAAIFGSTDSATAAALDFFTNL